MDLNMSVDDIASAIADDMMHQARASKEDEPVVFVTGNACFPAMRSFPDAERVYMSMDNEDGELWSYLMTEVDDKLENAMVFHEVGPDGSMYVVDLLRFRFIDYDDTAETISAQWQLWSAQMRVNL